MTNLKEVQKTAEAFENNVELLSKELKRLQSIKCRLKKQKGKSSYQEEMQDCLSKEQLVKEAKSLLEPKKKAVTMFDKEDVEKLDFDETIKALKSIQSKKSLTKWLTDKEGENDEYKAACKIEALLLEHKEKVQPVTAGHIRKTEIQTIIDTIESSGKLSQQKIVEMLKELI